MKRKTKQVNVDIGLISENESLNVDQDQTISMDLSQLNGFEWKEEEEEEKEMSTKKIDRSSS